MSSPHLPFLLDPCPMTASFSHFWDCSYGLPQSLPVDSLLSQNSDCGRYYTLHPTSAGFTCVFQGHCFASAASSAWCSFLKIYCWPISTSPVLGHMLRCPVSGFFDKFGHFRPSPMNGYALSRLIAHGKEVVTLCLLTIANARLSRILLCHKADLTWCYDVFVGCWCWTEGTGWILPKPLLEVIWWWKHIICSSICSSLWDAKPSLTSLNWLSCCFVRGECHSSVSAILSNRVSFGGSSNPLPMILLSSAAAHPKLCPVAVVVVSHVFPFLGP